MDLSWSGAVSNRIDVYRNGVLIVTVPNNSPYTDRIDARGKATYIHKVCEEGSATCLNEVTVSF